jgi:pyridoxine 5-phosphate synthase
VIELHTGCYADATNEKDRLFELQRIRQAAEYAADLQLIVNAGHGLHYHNVKSVASIKVLHELNIGHAIVSRALFCGLREAVKQMRLLMQEARNHVNDGCNCNTTDR